MFGTIGRAKIKPENRDKLVETMMRPEYNDVEGFRNAWLMFPESGDEVLIVAQFEDRDTYMRNAEDPKQHERYVEYRALLESEPEWTDGEWVEAPR